MNIETGTEEIVSHVPEIGNIDLSPNTAPGRFVTMTEEDLAEVAEFSGPVYNPETDDKLHPAVKVLLVLAAAASFVFITYLLNLN
jgi:hypothetical protein